MEANRKRSRGLFKGKLVPFYREPNPSSTVQYTATEVKQNHHSSPSPASVGFVVHQDYTITKRNPKVRIVVSDFDEFYAEPGDESVDTKASIYISTVQQRLMLERLSTEPKPNSF